MSDGIRGGPKVGAPAADPRLVTYGLGSGVIDMAVAQQGLGQALARTHQISAGVIAGTHQITGAISSIRNPQSDQLAAGTQTHQHFGVAHLVLGALGRWAGNATRRRHHTGDPGRLMARPSP